MFLNSFVVSISRTNSRSLIKLSIPIRRLIELEPKIFDFFLRLSESIICLQGFLRE